MFELTPLPVPMHDLLLNEIAGQETAIRLNNYDRLELPTDCSSGQFTREHRQLIGVLGEIEFRVAAGDPPTAPWSKTSLDGGKDYTLPDGATVQVMTACTDRCRYCYYPEFKPLKADIIVQAKFIERPRTIVLLGAITRHEFDAIALPRLIGSKTYPSIFVEQMKPLSSLLEHF